MNNDNKKPDDSLATSVLNQSKSLTKIWFTVWIITFLALVGTNAYWIHQHNSYDYVSQDGTGLNNINTGTQGDLLHGAEGENQEEQK